MFLVTVFWATPGTTPYSRLFGLWKAREGTSFIITLTHSATCAVKNP